MGIRVRIVSDFRQVEPEWDRLAAAAGAPPFLHPRWFAAFRGAFGGGEPHLATLERGGELVGVLPLHRRRGSLASITNWHTPGFDAVVAGPDPLEELGRGLLERPPRRLDLSFLGSGSETARALRAAADERGLATLERVIERPPFRSLDGSWDELWASLPSRRRSDLRRRRSRLSERGELDVQVHRGDGRLDRLLEEGFAVEAAGWKGERGTAINSNPRTRSFYEQVAAWSAERGWLRLWFLRLDGRPIAFAFCLADSRAHYTLKVGFDPSLGRFAPGTLLTAAMIEAAYEEGLQRYEFLGQAEPWKMVWTDQCHELIRLQVFAPTIAGTLSRLAWSHGRSAVRRLAARAGR